MMLRTIDPQELKNQAGKLMDAFQGQGDVTEFCLNVLDLLEALDRILIDSEKEKLTADWRDQ